MAGLNYGFRAGFRNRSLNSLLNLRKTVLMLTSIPFEMQNGFSFLQELTGERRTTRHMHGRVISC